MFLDDYYDESDFIDNSTPKSDDIVLCPTCNGSGEGMYDGSTCLTCKGKGEIYG